MKCLECGKEFTPATYNQKYCSYDCKTSADVKKDKIKRLIKQIATKNDFETKNESKIIRAKMMFFKDLKTIIKCPCDPKNDERYCGSPLCVADTVYLGHCHCSLFWNKNEPEIEKHQEGK